MSQNSSHDHLEGHGHLGHITPHWTRRVIVGGLLLNGDKFVAEIFSCPTNRPNRFQAVGCSQTHNSQPSEITQNLQKHLT